MTRRHASALFGTFRPGATMLATLCATTVLGAVAVVHAQQPVDPADVTIRFFAPQRRQAELARERQVVEAVDRANLARLHELLAREPHVAGSAGDARVVEAIAKEFEAMGLVVEKHPFWALLAEPVSAEVEILSLSPMQLRVEEPPIAGDPYSEAAGPTLGWNAYSGSGEATGEVVYANYGRKEDFEKLRELGVDVAGKIVVARYGGNFRGFKARFAEEAGAAGLLIYTDPRDSGYMQGLMKPEGGWATPWQIQRGSLKTLPYAGDPLTPGVEATLDAKRLDPEEVDLPHIPVQPLGWEAAGEILSRMQGPAVPGGAEGGWQGGLPFTYRLTGGPDLRVRMKVEQRRSVQKSFNVLGTIPGSERPEELVVVGSHHDAWVHGAMDPLAGTILVLEAARVLSEQVRAGWRPKRSIVFAAWGAEEFGIIGSTEWVESRKKALGLGGVAYINLDGAARGPNLGASASPTLKQTLIDAARQVPATDEQGEQTTLLARWLSHAADKDHPEEPRFGVLGGGSDHVAFYCHVGVPSAGLRGGGAPGDTYHSLYDNVHWYKRILDDDYRSAEMLTQLVATALLRLADADLPPYDLTRTGRDFARLVEALAEEQEGFTASPLVEAANRLNEQAARTQRTLLRAIEEGSLSAEQLDRVERLLLAFERMWIVDRPLAPRPWYRNVFAATDPASGYGAWPLPALREALESGDDAALNEAQQLYLELLEEMRQALLAAMALAS